jgi:hypothetical protein
MKVFAQTVSPHLRGNAVVFVLVLIVSGTLSAPPRQPCGAKIYIDGVE